MFLGELQCFIVLFIFLVVLPLILHNTHNLPELRISSLVTGNSGLRLDGISGPWWTGSEIAGIVNKLMCFASESELRYCSLTTEMKVNIATTIPDSVDGTGTGGMVRGISQYLATVLVISLQCLQHHIFKLSLLVLNQQNTCFDFIKKNWLKH